MSKSSSFFHPADGYVGDVIPYAWDGKAWLFYLHEKRQIPKPGTGWSLVTTSDFSTFEDRGVAISSGGASAADFNIYTGSIVFNNGQHIMFYTGQNPLIVGDDGWPLQVVMRAVSDDGMETWKRDKDFVVKPGEGYENTDWRDPFVVDLGDGDWRMLVTARLKEGPSHRRGVIAQLRSRDLRHWEMMDPLYAPNRYVAMECPEIFQWGDYWYLVYSEFSDAFVTRYRISSRPDGGWRAPKHDTIDGRAFYASKSLFLNDRRYFVGWVATKENASDSGDYQWAGTMAVVEAVQNQDGTLAFRIPKPVIDAFDRPLPIAPTREGELDQVHLEALDGYDSIISFVDAPDRFRLAVDIEFSALPKDVGVLLFADADDHAVSLRLEPQRNRLVLDRWPRQEPGREPWQLGGDRPYAIELERPCDLAPGTHHIDAVVDGEVIQVGVDGQTVLSTRIYDRSGRAVGFFVGDGTARFTNIRLLTS